MVDDLHDVFSQEDDDEETNPVKKIRNHAKKLERELKEARKELEELRAFKTQREAEDVRREAITKLQADGFNPKHVELFLKANPDTEATNESVQAFVKEFGLATSSEEEGSEESDQDKSSEKGGFHPAPPAGAPTPGKKTYSREEWKQLHAVRPDEAEKILREGRVEMTASL